MPVRPELERGDRAEIAAAAPQCPEQIGVLGLAGVAALAIRGDDIDRDEIVGRVAAFTGSPAEAAADGEAGNAGIRDDAAWDH